MKKLFCIVLSIPLAFMACSEDNISSIDDMETFEEFFEEWGTTITYHDVSSLKTNSILKELINKYPLGPWCATCSNLLLPGVTQFNKDIEADETAADLFKQSDCVPVLKSNYLINLKTPRESSLADGFFEMLLASDKFISLLSKQEKIQFMILALGKTKYEKVYVKENAHIMIGIMQSCGFTPFIEEIEPMLSETTNGYTLKLPDDDPSIFYLGFATHHVEIIVNYAKRFLNENI